MYLGSPGKTPWGQSCFGFHLCLVTMTNHQMLCIMSVYAPTHTHTPTTCPHTPHTHTHTHTTCSHTHTHTHTHTHHVPTHTTCPHTSQPTHTPRAPTHPHTHTVSVGSSTYVMAPSPLQVYTIPLGGMYLRQPYSIGGKPHPDRLPW